MTVRLLLPLGLTKIHPPTRSGQEGACFAQSGAQSFGHLPLCWEQFGEQAVRQICRRPEARFAFGQFFGQG